jgi:DNA-binding LytR/AlgR family response regulator
MKLKTIIVEDEIMSRKSLEKMCEKSEIIDLVDSCENGELGLRAIESNDIDLMFLDIEMPGLSGLELMEKLTYFPQVVFTTSKKEYAFEAFEYDIADFLRKPVTFPRFQKTLEKVEKNILQLNQTANFSTRQEMYLKQDGRLIRVPYDKVLYFENVGDYIKVFTEMGNFIIYGALKSIDARLDYPGFLKVHRSYIVNLQKIKDIEDNTLVIEKKVIPISRAHKPTLLKTINIL